MKRKIKRNLNLPESDMERLNRRLFRKRLRLIVRIVSAVLVMAVIAFAALCILCRVQDITVSNSSPYSDEALVSRISDSYGTSLVLFDSDSAVQKLRSAFPYLKTIKVKTVFPHEIHISVTSSEPVYSLLVADGEYLYLDGDLKVLEQSGLSRTGTVLVRGMTVSTYKVGSRLDRNINLECTTLCRIKELMDGVGLGSRITEIDMTKKYNYLTPIPFSAKLLWTFTIMKREDISPRIEIYLTILRKSRKKLLTNDRKCAIMLEIVW